MEILYVAFARMPTEKAHGVAIARSCETFARTGATVTLVVPKRATKIEGDVFSAYGLERNFTVSEIRIPDLVGRFGESKFAFWLHYGLFSLAVASRLLFGSRKRFIYTREAPLCFFKWIGYRVALESHLVSNRRGTYFFFARRAYRIIAISSALQGMFAAAGFDERDVLVAQSGVDLSVFDIDSSKEHARELLELPLDGKIAVYTGNFTTMDEDKGLNDIITALKDAPGVLFVAVGGNEKDIERYRVKAREVGVADQVILRGYAPQKTLAVYQKAADMLLMPFPDTPHYRNHMSPVKMFEYMASGRPIIASDLPTIREVLNGGNAIIVPPGDPAALAETLMRPHDAKLARQAYADVQKFTWDERARTIIAFL
ncbi:MAG TPA: glycosyltransferase [Candidatus Paceibacterota bacterium]|jgi:glycosyltransferase involved in cell wall biosynthesis|nr:glycosyltransferase [Candidatus Paceibacterota bacterium]